MKIVAIALLACIAAVYSAPTSISENNIGDIVNVDVSGSIDIDNTTNQRLVNFIAGYLNQQLVVAVAPGGDDDDEDMVPFKGLKGKLSPEVLNKLKSLMAKH